MISKSQWRLEANSTSTFAATDGGRISKQINE